jgi:hypothetical protein
MSTDTSSPLKTKSARFDFQRSEFEVRTPKARDCTKLSVLKRPEFQLRSPEARDCSQCHVHAQAPAPITTLPPQCAPYGAYSDFIVVKYGQICHAAGYMRSRNRSVTMKHRRLALVVLLQVA